MNTTGFSRRQRPDFVAEEVVAVLGKGGTFEFKELFEMVHAKLIARNVTSGGEEMLRLRAYEKLQDLVRQGAVKKTEKRYKGVLSVLASVRSNLEQRAGLAAAKATPAKTVSPRRSRLARSAQK